MGQLFDTGGADINICENIILGWRLFPQRDAIIFDDQRLTYADIERLSRHAAAVLAESGVQRGSRVAMVIPNVPAFVVWYYACLRLGAIAVSISTRLSSEEVAFILDDCQAGVVVGNQDLAELMAGHLPECSEQLLLVSDDGMRLGRIEADTDLTAVSSLAEGDYEEMEPDDPATILYTSGTTGFPKGATLSHRNVRATVDAFNHLCQMRPDDRLLLAVPLFHCYGQNALLNSGLHAGATIVLQRRFDLIESKRLIRQHRVTMLFGVPMTFQLMIDSCQDDDLRCVRYCFSAAATLSRRLSDGWYEKFGMPIYEGYGLTETAPFASYNHRLKFQPGSIGMPVDGVEMKIVDPDTGKICPPGVPGEIAIRGPNVMLGYWNRPRETAAALRGGWFHSGDIGRTDDQGYFYIVDRLKDMIVVGALKVFPAEVERVLLDHPDVCEAAVVGFADPVVGEKAVAFVVLESGATAGEHDIRQHCQLHLASYKVPGRVVMLDQLPRNPAGKVLKRELRQFNLASASEVDAAGENERPAARDIDPASRPDSSGPLLEQLRATHPASRKQLVVSFLQDELKRLTGRSQPIDPDVPILGEDVDSLMIVELRDRLQLQIGTSVQLPATIVFDHPVMVDLAHYLLESLQRGDVIAAETRSRRHLGRTTASNQASTDQSLIPDRKSTDPKPDRLSRADAGEGIEQMTEQQAMDALLRELSE